MEASELRCPDCSAEVASGQRFCGQCGGSLALRCSVCGTENSPGHKFCGSCGRPLGGARAGGERTAERRQLTVLFCDLVGSTALSERLDPEELREVMLAYQTACGEVVERRGGHVAQHLGDGLLVYFGYPAAHEDDPQRAVAAALEMVAAVHDLRLERLVGAEAVLEVRLGIHTGDVVTGQVGGRHASEQLALGSTPNVAARLQGLAEPGKVLISGVTRRLVRGFFDVEPLGERQLKGVREPLAVFQVTRERKVRSRFEAHTSRGLSPAIGRAAELAVFSDLAQRVRDGHGAALMVVGEAGIGKSRLVDLARQTLSGGMRWVACAGLEAYRNTAFHAARGFVEDLFGLSEETPPETAWSSLFEGSPPSEASAVSTALVGELLGLPADSRFESPELSPLRRRALAVEALVDLALHQADRQPTVLLVDDLHWVDPSSQEWLGQLLERGEGRPLLLAMTARPEQLAVWTSSPRVRRIELDRLTPDEIESVAVGVAGGKALPRRVVAQIVDKTDGVPLFVEELTQSILESGALIEEADAWRASDTTFGLERLQIPATLKDSLMARLDRLGPAKRTAQMGSILGREFSYERLDAVSRLRSDELAERLDRLVESGLVFRRGRGAEARYLFKHALVEDTAYGSLLRSERRHLHQRVAAVLREGFPEVEKDEPEVLAHHYEGAGRIGDAIDWLLTAARGATESAAYVEARRWVEHGLELAAGWTDPEEPTQRLGLEMAYAVPLIATTGYTSRAVEETYHRTWELCRRLGRREDGFGVQYRTWGLYWLRGDMDEAGRRVEELKEAAAAWGGSLEHGAAESAEGTAFCYEGRWQEALALLGAASERFRPELHPSILVRFADDFLWGARLNRAVALAIAGRVTEARSEAGRIVVESEAMGDVLELTRTLMYSCAIGREIGAPLDGVLAAAERGRELAMELGFPLWQAFGDFWSGWALGRLGDPEGVVRMRQGMGMLAAMGFEITSASNEAYFAEAQQAAGDPAQALAAARSSREVGALHGVHHYEAEAWRIEGELLADDEPDEAAACLRRAIDGAGTHGAALHRLRAAVSLARLASAGSAPRGEASAALAAALEAMPEPDHELVREAESLAGSVAG